jgi:hypothetical protein
VRYLEALQSAQAAMPMRVRTGRVSVTDGPFAETNELLGAIVCDREVTDDTRRRRADLSR